MEEERVEEEAVESEEDIPGERSIEHMSPNTMSDHGWSEASAVVTLTEVGGRAEGVAAVVAVAAVVCVG